MKVAPRKTDTRVVANRITAPEARKDPKTGKNIAMLGFIDAAAYQRHVPTTKGLFVYAAGTNEEGEVSDGLDRLQHHKFVVHKNSSGKAIGLDIIPSRLYRSGVVPKSQDGVRTVTIRYEADGAVARVVSRPFNLRFDQSQQLIIELDKLISAGKTITATMRLGIVGRVVNVTENSVEVRINASPRNVQGQGKTDMDDIEEEQDKPARSAGQNG